MELNVKKIGNSQGVILPKIILTQLNIEEGGKFTVSISEGKLILEPVIEIREGWAKACQRLANHPDYGKELPDFFDDDTLFDLPE
ncbi:MAG: AbrB/MazE/SpoVT family DNA-binding domain-containing protein [Marinifilaceae bacterium]